MDKLNETVVLVNQKLLVCQDAHVVVRNRRGPFRNPLRSAFTLLMFQLGFIAVISHIINLGLQPLGQSIIVSQILVRTDNGGLVVGPSVLGRQKEFAITFFPLRGNMPLETMATFGIMFFFFSISVKMDCALMLRPGKKAMAIGGSVLFFTTALPAALAIVLKKCIAMDDSLHNSLISLAASQSLTGFPVIACLLDELKMLNSDIGRVALSSSMFCDLIGMFITATSFSFAGPKGGDPLRPMWCLLSTLALVCSIVFLCRPAIIGVVRLTPEGKHVKELHIFSIFLLVLVSGLLGEIIGQHYLFGPMILGLVIPDGPPLGSALSAKLESIGSGLLFPAYLAVSGLQTDVFKIQFRSLWIMGIIVIFGFFVKIAATMIPAMYFRMSARDALVLGLVMNAKGIIEITVYNILKESKIIMEQEFSLGILSVVIVTAIVTPLIKLLHDPASKYRASNRSTIQHSKRDQEFRILICIHNQDSIPTIINLLEISHSTEESNVAVIVLFLVELVGKTSPILIAHQQGPSSRSLLSTTSFSAHAVNALRQYQVENEGCAFVQSFTSMSPWDTMHDDICRMALDKRSAIVIVPFHKQWTIDGSIASVNRAIQQMNIKVLKWAPCSVGILVERGVLGRSISVLTSKSPYHVVVLFLGGPDDAESLAYGARMAYHENVDLTVVRFILFGSENGRERKRDSDLIDEYRHAHTGNDRFVYAEEFVKDGVGLGQCITRMRDCFDLMLVGRHHPDTSLLVGLDEWSECLELGVMGDMLASPDFGIKASVLVIQQQKTVRSLDRNMQSMMNDREPLIHDIP
ncbi:hypothetical protein ACFE04_017284 [Oxalis oulophora]